MSKIQSKYQKDSTYTICLVKNLARLTTYTAATGNCYLNKSRFLSLDFWVGRVTPFVFANFFKGP